MVRTQRGDAKNVTDGDSVGGVAHQAVLQEVDLKAVSGGRGVEERCPAEDANGGDGGVCLGYREVGVAIVTHADTRGIIRLEKNHFPQHRRADFLTTEIDACGLGALLRLNTNALEKTDVGGGIGDLPECNTGEDDICSVAK